MREGADFATRARVHLSTGSSNHLKDERTQTPNPKKGLEVHIPATLLIISLLASFRGEARRVRHFGLWFIPQVSQYNVNSPTHNLCTQSQNLNVCSLSPVRAGLPARFLLVASAIRFDPFIGNAHLLARC